MPRTSRKNQARTRRRDKSVATNNANFTSEELFAQHSNGDPSKQVRRLSRISYSEKLTLATSNIYKLATAAAVLECC